MSRGRKTYHKNKIKTLKGQSSQLENTLSTAEEEIRKLKSEVKRLSQMLVRLNDELQKQDKKIGKAKSKLNVKVNKLNGFYSIVNPISTLVAWIASIGMLVGLFWQLANQGHWEGDVWSYHFIPDWTGSYIFLLFLLLAIVTFSAIHKLKKRYNLLVATARAEYWNEVQTSGQINLKLGRVKEAVHEAQNKLQEEQNRRDRIKFLIEQKVKGLVCFVDRLGRERWGSPEQVKEWKIVDIDMRNNFVKLSPWQFEKLVATLLGKMGYQTQLTPKTADFGADIIAVKGGDRVVVQVKKYNYSNKVGNQSIQRLLGSMFKYKANKAIFVTTSDFTDYAYQQATGAPIELWNHNKLCEKIEEYILKYDSGVGENHMPYR